MSKILLGLSLLVATDAVAASYELFEDRASEGEELRARRSINAWLSVNPKD